MPIILVDFDDTISTPGEVYPEIGPPQDGVREALREMHDMGCRVRIHTCRCNGNAASDGMLPVELKRIVDYMQANDLYFDDVVMPEEGKPFANYYVDDKGIQYQRNWPAVMDVIRVGLRERVARDRKVGQEVVADKIATRMARLQGKIS